MKWKSATELRIPQDGSFHRMKWVDGETEWEGNIFSELADLKPEAYKNLMWLDKSDESPSGSEEQQEKILCAAIWYKEQPTSQMLPTNIEAGTVICGHRHGHCIYTFCSLTGKRSVIPECGEYVQGFITNKNRFVDRQEAYKIAFNQNQIIGPNKGYAENSIGLTSEDIY